MSTDSKGVDNQWTGLLDSKIHHFRYRFVGVVIEIALFVHCTDCIINVQVQKLAFFLSVQVSYFAEQGRQTYVHVCSARPWGHAPNITCACKRRNGGSALHKEDTVLFPRHGLAGPTHTII